MPFLDAEVYGAAEGAARYLGKLNLHEFAYGASSGGGARLVRYGSEESSYILQEVLLLDQQQQWRPTLLRSRGDLHWEDRFGSQRRLQAL